MTKKTLTASLVLCAALFMGGCGSSDTVVDNTTNGNNDEIITATEFTQSLLSANQWYMTGSDAGGEIWCNATFVFDGNNNLTASWKENGVSESVTIPYTLTDGKVIIEHDGQVDTETLLSSESDRLLVSAVEERPEETTTADYIWFVNKTDAEAYLAEHGVESCYP